MQIIYSPSFVKRVHKLNKNLQDEVLEKIELFKNKDNHIRLKVHALSGRFKGSYSFSVNYTHRVIFEYINKNKKEVMLLDIGNHDIYK